MRVYDAMVQYRAGYAEFTATNFYKQQRDGVNGEIPNLVQQIDGNIRKSVFSKIKYLSGVFLIKK